ncbi:MAG: hypothetical protein IJG36_03720 [Synergistaceae bacterium]|nr:hypothetical protein [Synergistaceae bacterium]
MAVREVFCFRRNLLKQSKHEYGFTDFCESGMCSGLRRDIRSYEKNESCVQFVNMAERAASFGVRKNTNKEGTVYLNRERVSRR